MANAAAAHSAPLEFQHLEDSDADLLFSDVADDLDLNDELEQPSEDSETETDDELIADGELDVLDTKNGNVTDVANCPLGTRLEAGNCVSCPNNIRGTLFSTSYTVDGNTGVCGSCAAQYDLVSEKQAKMCLSLCQQGQMKIQQMEVNKCAGNKPTVDDSVRCGRFDQAIGNTCPKTGNKLLMDLQSKSCPVGKTCCLQGWYGEHPNCIQCPSSAPSSPRTANGGPDSNCNCPNAAASSCFACSNVCRPFNVATGICTPICSTCKVITVGGVKKPSNC